LRPYADQLADNDILDRIEESERRVDDFLVACGFDLTSLDQATQDQARDLSTYRANEVLAPLLPVTNELREMIKTGAKELGDAIEKSFASRKKLTIQKVRAIMKEIAEEEEEL